MAVHNLPKKVVIAGYSRIPFARQFTNYATASNRDMMVAAMNGLIDKYNLADMQLGEVAGGAVIKHSWEINLMRECVLHTSLDPKTPACDLQQACNTGFESALYIANKIALGQIECGIAGGVDSTSNVPLVLNEHVRRILLDARRSKSTWDKIKLLAGIKVEDFSPIAPANLEPGTGLSMGGHTEYTAKYYNISREEQDAFALSSHQKMAAADDRGFFNDMIVPFMGLDSDNNLRRDSSIEKLAKLRPAFDKEHGSLTAGNSSPLTDGASCILLASEEWAQQQGLSILAYITHAELSAIEYIENKHNLLLAPVYAAPRMLKKAGLTLQDFDFYEIHEAFAAQVLALLKIWESPQLSAQFGVEALGSIDLSKLNVNGSSLATGHPFAATGGRILATMAKLLDEKGSGRGLISVCAAGGQGMTFILEK